MKFIWREATTRKCEAFSSLTLNSYKKIITKGNISRGDIIKTANYTEYAKIFKVLADPKRLQIIDMLSGGELCACKLLEAFQITQPTLSHDMKLLCDAGLVTGRKEGKWTHYSLNMEKMNEVYKEVGRLMVPKEFKGLLECDCEGK